MPILFCLTSGTKCPANLVMRQRWELGGSFPGVVIREQGGIRAMYLGHVGEGVPVQEALSCDKGGCLGDILTLSVF